MKSIDTLVPDIYNLFRGETNPFSPENILSFSSKLSEKISNRVSEHRGDPVLRLSNLGTPCRRKLWYSINLPKLAEPLNPEARIKFLYGDILEEVLLYLAKEAGHDVQFEQATVNLHSVEGHIDGIIDGVLVDVKSASSYSFLKFASGLTSADDSFGYLTQLDGYLHSVNDLHLGELGAFLVIDKTLGHLCLDKHTKSMVNYAKIVADTKQMLELPEPPPRKYVDEDFGKSGNRKLGIVCSYCNFKKLCWPKLRTFVYSNGPVFLTKVIREPDVPEG